MSTPSKKNVIVKGMILDSSGHTELAQTPAEALATIVEQVSTAGKWVFVNGNPFLPKDINDPVEQKVLENMFYERENPEYQLTGTLKGGAKVVKAAKKTKAKNKLVFRSQVIKAPVSSLFNTKNRPQMAIIFKTNGGKEYLDVVTTDYKGSRAKLSRHKEHILVALNKALGGVA